MIARILHGGMVAQQGLLHVGDIIKEVNGQPVGSDPRALQELLRNASGSVILKILPSYQEPHLPRQVGPSPSTRPKGWLSLLAVRVAGLTEALLSYWFPPGKMGVGPAAQGQLTAAADRPLPLLRLHMLPHWLALCTQPQPGVQVYERAPALWSAFFTFVRVRRVGLSYVLDSCLLVGQFWGCGCSVYLSYWVSRPPPEPFSKGRG